MTLLAGVSKFLFSAMALAVVVSLFASYVVAMTVVPLFCARYLKHATRRSRRAPAGWGARFNAAFNARFNRMLGLYEALVQRVLRVPATVLVLFFVAFAASLLLYSRLGFAYFPQTDAGQFVITFKAPSGTKLTVTEKEVANLESSDQRRSSGRKISASSSTTSASTMASPPSTRRTPPCTPASFRWA